MFTLAKTVGDVRPALLGCCERLGGVPEALVFDNDASIVARRESGRARLHPEVAALLGALSTKPVVLAPRRPTSKGQVERTIGYLKTEVTSLDRPGVVDSRRERAQTVTSASTPPITRSRRRLSAGE